MANLYSRNQKSHECMRVIAGTRIAESNSGPKANENRGSDTKIGYLIINWAA